jgi:hypothetical protein
VSPYSSHLSSSGVTHSEALRVSVVRWVVVYSSRSENPPMWLGVSRSAGPADGTACADSPRQIIRRETLRRTLEDRWLTFRA